MFLITSCRQSTLKTYLRQEHESWQHWRDQRRNIRHSFSLIIMLISEELPHTSTSGDLGLWNVKQSPFKNNWPLCQETCLSVHLYISTYEWAHRYSIWRQTKQLLSVHLTNLLIVWNLRSPSGLSNLTCILCF